MQNAGNQCGNPKKMWGIRVVMQGIERQKLKYSGKNDTE